MAISFFKKSFSAYYGYQNKITNPDTVDEEEESDEEKSINQSSDNDETEKLNKLTKSKSAIEIVNSAKENLIDKISTNVSKFNAYENFFKNLNYKEKSNEGLNKINQESISFNIYEHERNSKYSPNQPLSLIFPNALPDNFIEKTDELEYQNDDTNVNLIDLTKYDEYGFLKIKNRKSSNLNEINTENLLKFHDDIEKNDEQNDNLKKELNQLPNDELAKKNEKEFEILKNKWLNYLELTYNEIDESTTKWYQIENKIKHTAKLDNLIVLGVPYFLRNQLWPRFSDAYLMKEKCEINYSQLCSKSDHIKNLNDKQSLRILSNNICFQDQFSKSNLSLKRILRVIKWIERNGIDHTSTNLNNLQTLNLPLIAAYLLLIFSEEDTFWLLLSILNEWKLIFVKNQSFINKSSNQDLVKNLIKKYCSELDEKLNQEEIDINVLIDNWLISLFADVISETNILFYLFDLYFYYGFIVIVQLIFGLFFSKKEELIKLTNSVDLINKISSLPDELQTKEKLYEIWQIGKNNLSNLEQEFYLIKNKNELQNELIRIGVPAVQLFSENTNGIKLLPTSTSLNHLTDLNNELKFKNVWKSAIFYELNESILAIAQHFALNSNDNDLKFNLEIDYDFKNINKFYKTHKSNLDKKSDKNSDKNLDDKFKKARALIDFKRIDDDELGFRKNDIIKILDDTDEHCWIGELNDQQGCFPAKFVQILNKNFGPYSEFGDDACTPYINDLVRGRLCAVIKLILSNGLRKQYFFTLHPWIVFDQLAKNYMKVQQNNICSKLVLTKTFKLDDFENNLNVKELFYKSILFINESHSNEAMDVKLRSLICVALNHKMLAEWFEILCNEDKNLIKKYYHSYSFLTTPVWQMIKMNFSLLKQFSFSLNPNAELIQEEAASSTISKANIRDMLIKHHLFSWQI